MCGIVGIIGKSDVVPHLLECLKRLEYRGYDSAGIATLENGGIDRRIRLFRLPDDNPHRAVTVERRIPLADDKDNALYARITFEDGHLAWSSPIYIFK